MKYLKPILPLTEDGNFLNWGVIDAHSTYSGFSFGTSNVPVPDYDLFWAKHIATGGFHYVLIK